MPDPTTPILRPAALRHRTLVALGVVDRHTPGGKPHNQLDHGRGGVASLLASLRKASALGGVAFDDDDYVDWSTRLDDGSFQFDAGNGIENINMDVSIDHLAKLQDALADSLSPPVGDDGFELTDDEDDNRGWYWQPLDDNDTWQVQLIQADGGSVEYEWSTARMQQWLTALTVTLLTEATKPEE